MATGTPSNTTLPCPNCDWWVESRVIGMKRAEEMLAKHRRGSHPAPIESNLFALPILLAKNLGVTAEEIEQLRAEMPETAPLICRTCHALPCACPQDVIAPRHASLSITFVAPSSDELVEIVRTWLAEMEGPMQGPHKLEGQS